MKTLLTTAGVVACGGLAYVWAWEPSAKTQKVTPHLTGPGYTITLPDGRRVGVKEYGDRKGKPIFQFHGAGSSRYEAAALCGGETDACSDASARLIALDRPGYGASDPQPRRTLLDYPSDVLAVADALGINNFAVMGVSSGGCYAIACAYSIPRSQPGRLTGVALVSSDGPHRAADAPALVGSERMPRMLLGYAPFIPAMVLKIVRRMLYTSPDAYLASVSSTFGGADAATMAMVPTDVALRAGKEGLKQGIWSLIRDLQLQIVEPWGFDLGDVSAGDGIPIDVWYGEDDQIVHPDWGCYLARKIPGAREHRKAGEGHVSLIHRHLGDVLAAAVAATPTGGDAEANAFHASAARSPLEEPTVY